MLADMVWRRGESAARDAHLEDARRLIAGAPPGRGHASVLGQIARYAMLAQRDDEALAIGEEALAIAEQLGLDDVRADVLITRGTVRLNGGDRRASDDFEEGTRIASELNLMQELMRAKNNVIALHVIFGDLEGAVAAQEELFRLGDQYGQRNLVRFAEGTRVANAYVVGDWKLALEHAEPFLADVAGGARRYQSGAVHLFRGWIRLARGDTYGAVADAEEAVQHIQMMRDPQAFQTVRSLAASLFVTSGSPDRARELLAESMEFLPHAHPFGFVAVELHHLAWVASSVGRESEFLEILDTEPFKSVWLGAARAIVSGDLAQGADILEQAGARSYAAFYRLYAETDEQVRRALDFYRSVGATRFIREGEALLAASA